MPAAPDPAAPPALDYAPRPTVKRRWGRRLLRWWPAWLLLTLGGLGIAYGPRVWRHYKVMRLQEACMAAEMPADRPVYETDRAAAAGLISAWPGEYQRDVARSAVRVDPRWVALAAELGIPLWPGTPPGVLGATTFCHERFTPDGRRRLVVVELGTLVAVIEPTTWVGGGAARLRSRDNLYWKVPDPDLLVARAGLLGATSFRAGIPDPADRSRWTMPFACAGVRGTYEYRLGDDDRVTVRELDPDAFAARAKAVAATRPTPQPPREGEREKGVSG